MKKKFIFLVITGLVIFTSVFFIVDKMTNENSIIYKKAIKLDNKTIVSQFINNEQEANKLFVGKTVEVEGVVKKISFLNDEQTIFLNTPYSDIFIICEMSSKQEQTKKIIPNQTLKVKGTCKGFLKDVILLNCYIPADE
jgi:hypothetical protein